MIFLFRPRQNSPDDYERIVYEFAEDALENHNRVLNDFSSHGDLVAFKNELQEHNEAGVVFLAYCHGNNDELLIQTPDLNSINSGDAQFFRNKFCYFVSCESLRDLGNAFMDSGASGVVGYERPIIFLIERHAIEAVKRCVNSGIKHWLVHGGTSEEICRIVKNTYDEELRKLDEQNCLDSDLIYTYGVLRANRASLGFL